MEIVINTTGYKTICSCFVTQITLPNGKYYYTGEGSVVEMVARSRRMKHSRVFFCGACIYQDINKSALQGIPIQIDGVSTSDFIEKIATCEELNSFLSD